MSHVFADFLRKLLVEKQNPMKIFGDGEQVRCFTWIDKVAEAIATQSFADATTNEAYNLANPEPVTMKELAERIFEEGKKRGIVRSEELEFDHVSIYDDDVKKRVPAVDKAVDHFNWDPQIKLEDSLDQCIDNMNKINDEI